MKLGDKVIIKCRCGLTCSYSGGVYGKYVETILDRCYAIIFDEDLNKFIHEDFLERVSSIREATKSEIRDKDFIISVRQPDEVGRWNNPSDFSQSKKSQS